MDFSNLTRAQHQIIDVLRVSPAATNAEIGTALGGKTERTIENQLGDMYKRLALDMIEPYDKRRILLVVGILRDDLLNQVVTATEAAALFGISDSTVRKAIAAGHIQARQSGKTWLLRRSDAAAIWGKE